MNNIVKWFLIAGLLVGVYFEAGSFTMLSFLSIFITFEVIVFRFGIRDES